MTRSDIEKERKSENFKDDIVGFTSLIIATILRTENDWQNSWGRASQMEDFEHKTCINGSHRQFDISLSWEHHGYDKC